MAAVHLHRLRFQLLVSHYFARGLFGHVSSGCPDGKASAPQFVPCVNTNAIPSAVGQRPALVLRARLPRWAGWLLLSGRADLSLSSRRLACPDGDCSALDDEGSARRAPRSPDEVSRSGLEGLPGAFERLLVFPVVLLRCSRLRLDCCSSASAGRWRVLPSCSVCSRGTCRRRRARGRSR